MARIGLVTRSRGLLAAREHLPAEEIARRAIESVQGPSFTRSVRRGVALLGEFPCPALLPDGTSVRDVEAAKRWLVAYLARYETTKNGSRKLKPRNNAQQLAPSAE